MTKFVQKSAIVLMIVVAVLCLVGCGPLFVSDDGYPVGKSFYPEANVTGGIGCLYVDKESNKQEFMLTVIKTENLYIVHADYKDTGEMANGWFSSGTINGNNFSGDFCIKSYKDSASINAFNLSKNELQEMLPSSGNWTIKFLNDSHTDRKVTYVIPAEYASQVSEWINAN